MKLYSLFSFLFIRGFPCNNSSGDIIALEYEYILLTSFKCGCIHKRGGKAKASTLVLETGFHEHMEIWLKKKKTCYIFLLTFSITDKQGLLPSHSTTLLVLNTMFSVVLVTWFLLSTWQPMQKQSVKGCHWGSMLNVTQQDADCISVGVLLLCFDYVCCKEKPSCAYSVHISPPLWKTCYSLLICPRFNKMCCLKTCTQHFQRCLQYNLIMKGLCDSLPLLPVVSLKSLRTSWLNIHTI